MNRAMPLPAALPPDVRLMNTVSVFLGLLFVAMALALCMAWLVRQPLFNLDAIRVGGDLTHSNAATLRAHVAPKLAGNFLTVDLESTRAAFESVPWVRRAMVQREFPNRLKVVLQEHRAVAYWGPESQARLVNNHGEVFEANPGDVENQELPWLAGPTSQAPQVLQAYQELLPLFERMDAVIEQLELSELGSWRALLDSGAVIELGDGSLAQVQARAQRFIDTVTQVSSRFGRDVESADLRYASGYALKLRGVTTAEVGDKDDKKKKR